VGAMVRISEIIKHKDYDTYIALKRAFKYKESKKNKDIELGDSPQNLMKHDAYKRIGRRIKQIKWSE